MIHFPVICPTSFLTTFLSLPLLQLPGLPCSPPYTPSTFQPQGLCTCLLLTPGVHWLAFLFLSGVCSKAITNAFPTNPCEAALPPPPPTHLPCFTLKKKKKKDCFIVFVCLPHDLWIFVPRPGIEPSHSAVKAQSCNHWTTREFPTLLYFFLTQTITCLTIYIGFGQKVLSGFSI